MKTQPQTAEGFFYSERDKLTRESATTVLKEVIRLFGAGKSVVDVGCGVGTWLSVARELGFAAIAGFEGDWVKDEQLQIEKKLLTRVDLESAWKFDRTFDLGINLEVAEHLTPTSGARLVKNLTSCCKIVLFSAATPGQGGNGHINEQWPNYWQNIFREHGYEGLDCIRPAIWYEGSIPWWYRENIFVFAPARIVAEYYQNLAANLKERSPNLIGALTRQNVSQNEKGKDISGKEAIKFLGRSIRRRF